MNLQQHCCVFGLFCYFCIASTHSLCFVLHCSVCDSCSICPTYLHRMLFVLFVLSVSLYVLLFHSVVALAFVLLCFAFAFALVLIRIRLCLMTGILLLCFHFCACFCSCFFFEYSNHSALLQFLFTFLFYFVRLCFLIGSCPCSVIVPFLFCSGTCLMMYCSAFLIV